MKETATQSRTCSRWNSHASSRRLLAWIRGASPCCWISASPLATKITTKHGRSFFGHNMTIPFRLAIVKLVLERCKPSFVFGIFICQRRKRQLARAPATTCASVQASEHCASSMLCTRTPACSPYPCMVIIFSNFIASAHEVIFQRVLKLMERLVCGIPRCIR